MSALTDTEIQRNTIKAIRFEHPDFIPMTFWICDAVWHHYPQEAILELIDTHPMLQFPCFERPKLPYTPNYACNARKDRPYTDSFGCIWETADDGITGTVTGHPLADWDDFDSWVPPDPKTCDGRFPTDWAAVRQEIQRIHDRGGLYHADLRHGHTFLQLCDIRGYENLMYDMMDEEPKLLELIDILEQFNTEIVKFYISAGADTIGFPEDLGMQVGPMLSPEHFRRYIKPSYRRMMSLVRDAGIPVHMHSDGDIRTLADELIEGGVQCINLQDLVNGIDWIADHLRGKVCIDLDIDRQVVTPCATPREIDALIREEVTRLGRPEGGLTMVYGLYPGVPLENIKAVMDAMEKYSCYYD